MFLYTNPSQTGYTRDGSQRAGGPFLILFSGEERYPDPENPARTLPVVRACVRSVRLSQLGHFMMGSAQLGKYRVTLSGTYGDDGLTRDAAKYPGLWETLLELPRELTTKLWNGGGHNSAGSEAPAMRAWARANVRQLRQAGKAR